MAEDILELKKQEILDMAKVWFKEVIVENHKKNTAKLENPKEFDINPFLAVYLAAFLEGEVTPETIAKALIYARSLSTSITTSFGTNMQKFVSDVLSRTFGSTTQGIDIEFVDQLDGRKKYCQVKLGPNTINRDDVTTIDNHFSALKRLARTNNVRLELGDMAVGVMYGDASQVSAHYKSLRDNHNYSLYVGKELWTRLTGDANFYEELISAIGSVAVEANGKELLQTTINKLAAKQTIVDLADMGDNDTVDGA